MGLVGEKGIRKPWIHRDMVVKTTMVMVILNFIRVLDFFFILI